VGQDGSRYNGSLNRFDNSAVPDSVAEALYAVSDHLPVELTLAMRGLPASAAPLAALPVRLLGNPARERVEIHVDAPGRHVVQVRSALGQLWAQEVVGGTTVARLDVRHLPAGVYVVQVLAPNGRRAVRRLVKL
ncbi:MAG: T9SS type A sorting domain-containing protein, partial [Catalinimonas sp.]